MHLNNGNRYECIKIEREIDRRITDSVNKKNRHYYCDETHFKDHRRECRFNFPRLVSLFLKFCLSYLRNELYNVEMEAFRNDA